MHFSTSRAFVVSPMAHTMICATTTWAGVPACRLCKQCLWWDSVLCLQATGGAQFPYSTTEASVRAGAAASRPVDSMPPRTIHHVCCQAAPVPTNRSGAPFVHTLIGNNTLQTLGVRQGRHQDAPADTHAPPAPTPGYISQTPSALHSSSHRRRKGTRCSPPPTPNNRFSFTWSHVLQAHVTRDAGHSPSRHACRYSQQRHGGGNRGATA